MSDEANQVAAGDAASSVGYGPVLAALAAAGVVLVDGDDVLAITATTIGSLQGRVGELETLNGVLATEKAALEAKLAAVDAAPKAKSAKAPKRRNISELEGDGLSSPELLELVRAASKVEVAFSDGKRELNEIPARVISGDAWAVTVAGLALRGVDIELTGLGGGVEIVGYGLLLDGELAAYRKRMDPLMIAPGAKVNLAGDIVF